MTLLLFSMEGYFLLLRRLRKDLNPAFYPALTVSIISVMTCLGGMAGLLFWTARALWVIGLSAFFLQGILFFRKIIRKETKDQGPFLRMCGSFLFFFVGMILLTRNRFIYHYDDFSHWGLVVKIMLQMNRMPASSDGLLFPSYPLGSASFLYFFCSVPGSGAEYLLTAQSVMLVSFLLSLQSVAEKKWACYLLASSMIPLFLFYNTPLDGLPVDNLLGAAYLAAMLLYLRKNREPGKALPEIMLILACCVLIKNSGIFLALGLMMLIVVWQVREKKRIQWIWLWMALPLMVFLAWRIHLKIGFTDYGKHYMSVYTYYGTLRGKLGEIGQIFRVILPVMINPLTNHALWLIPAFALVYRITVPERQKEQERTLRICAVFFVLYEAGILLMYICSMGTGELYMQNGRDFPRYNGTILCVLAGVLMEMISRSGVGTDFPVKKRKSLFLMIAIILMVGCMGMNLTSMKTLEECSREYPEARALSIATDGQIYTEEGEYAVIFPKPAVAGYEQYMAAYYLYPAKNIRCYGTGAEILKFGDGVSLIDLRQE